MNASRELKKYGVPAVRVPSHLSAVIVGAQKAGTTSLLRYLSQHPQLCGHAVVEFSFFNDSEYGRGWESAASRYFYDYTPGQELIAKYAILSQSDECLRRLAKHSPESRLVLIVRDPVYRAFSSYRMERNHGSVVKPFDHLLSCFNGDPSDLWKWLFLDFGHYASTLRRIYRHFDPAQVTVLIHEEFIGDPGAACRRLFSELGVDHEFVPDTTVVHNAHRLVRSQRAAAALRWLRGPSNPIRRSFRRALSPRTFNRLGITIVEANRGLYSQEEIDPAVRDALGDYYRPFNEELEELLGHDLSRWTGMGQRSGASTSRIAPDRIIADRAR